MSHHSDVGGSSRDRRSAPLADHHARVVSEVEAALQERKGLSQRFLKEIEKEIAEATKMLRLLGDPWKHGPDSLQYEFMRIALDKALTARKKERRERLLQSWKDLFELKQKMIELERDVAALQVADSS